MFCWIILQPIVYTGVLVLADINVFRKYNVFMFNAGKGYIYHETG
jgi:hypothetical protein